MQLHTLPALPQGKIRNTIHSITPDKDYVKSHLDNSE